MNKHVRELGNKGEEVQHERKAQKNEPSINREGPKNSQTPTRDFHKCPSRATDNPPRRQRARATPGAYTGVRALAQSQAQSQPPTYGTQGPGTQRPDRGETG